MVIFSYDIHVFGQCVVDVADKCFHGMDISHREIFGHYGFLCVIYTIFPHKQAHVPICQDVPMPEHRRMRLFVSKVSGQNCTISHICKALSRHLSINNQYIGTCTYLRVNMVYGILVSSTYLVRMVVRQKNNLVSLCKYMNTHK